MNSIVVIEKKLAKNRDYYSQNLIAWCMILKLKMFVTILVRIENL